MVDQQTILKLVDTHKMATTEKNLDILGVGQRLLRKRVPGQEGTGVAATTSQKLLRSVGTKVIVEVSYDTLKVNIEQDKLVDHFMRICATQIGNDAEDLGFNGDTTSADDFLNINDGWLKHALSANIYDTNASVDYLSVVFPGMLNAMPNVYKRDPKSLAFIVAPSVKEAYIKQLAAAGYGAESYKFLTGENQPLYMGIPLVSAPFTSSVKHILTDPKNLAWGVNSEGISREMDRDIKKQLIIAVYSLDLDYKIKNDSAAVLGYNA
jgi:hypothetical protein